MKHRTSELTGARLNAAVAKALCASGDPVLQSRFSRPIVIESLDICVLGWGLSDDDAQKWAKFTIPPGIDLTKAHPAWDEFFRDRQYSPSTNLHDEGLKIIEREHINLTGRDRNGRPSSEWCADMGKPRLYFGPTALIAAMRAFVAHKLGDEVEL